MAKRKVDPCNLTHRCICDECGGVMKANAVPFGDPLALLITGVCQHCYSTRISVDAMQSGDVRTAAMFLAEFFQRVGMSEMAQTQH